MCVSLTDQSGSGIFLASRDLKRKLRRRCTCVYSPYSSASICVWCVCVTQRTVKGTISYIPRRVLICQDNASPTLSARGK